MKDTFKDMQNGSTRSWHSKGHVNGGPATDGEEEEEEEAEDQLSDGSSIDFESEPDAVKACKKLQRARSQSCNLDWRAFSILSFNSNLNRKRKLIIHLDLRNTILVADSVTNVSMEEALNSFLTGVVWGSEVDGLWRWDSTIPSLKAPAPGVITYYKYLEKNLVQTPENRMNLRLQTGDFVHTPVGKVFQKHFEIHLARLAWEYEIEHDKVLTMSGRDGKPYHYILPSVYKLILHLTERRRDFSIVLRTYGKDAPNVLSSLHHGLRGHHPLCRNKPVNIQVHTNPGLIKRTDNKFELSTYKAKAKEEVQQLLTHDRDIYRFLCASQGISGFVDDFLFWQKKNYDHAAGKPLLIDPNDDRHHHIIFDDNFRADDEDSIVDVRMFTRGNPITAESLSHSDVSRLENACLVQADLLESIADEDYFIRMTNLCEDNYARMIKTGQL